MSDLFETDVEINKVYEGKSGEGEYGPWTAYNFYVRDDERKFSWFKSESKPIIPVQGMRIKLMEYVVKQSGEYTNYNVTRIILHGDVQKEGVSTKSEQKVNKSVVQTGNNQGRDNTLTMYISYAKDLTVQMMVSAPDGFVGSTITEIADMVVDEGIRMYDRANLFPPGITETVEKGFLDEEYEGIRDDEPPPPTDADFSRR